MNTWQRPLLADHWKCFEGVVPSVVVTASRDGTPNVSYISHVYYIDEDHVALSNQFMSKLVRNVMENPRLQVAVVNSVTGVQLILDLLFERAETSGPLFDTLATLVTAVASHHGMDHVMRLRSADIYRVLEVEVQGFEPGAPDAPALRQPRHDILSAAVPLTLALARVDDLDQAIDQVLNGLVDQLRIPHCMVFLADPDRHALTAIASRGYSRQGAGAEVRWGEGVIGMAAERTLALRFSCVGRNFLYADNVKAAGRLSPDPSRVIPMPGLDAPQSLLAVPMIAGGDVRGLIYAESKDRLAFTPTDEQSVSLIAAQLAAIVALVESSQELDAARSASATATPPADTNGKAIHLQRFAYDDSVFIGHDYVIKGVPGRLLWRMLQDYAKEGRREFTNREFRLDATLKLPDFKDNLESRLLLLSRRLAENNWPVRILRNGRGRVLLEVDGPLVLEEM
jgi:adenylate cyclase